MDKVRWFRDMSISRKLLLVALLVTGMAVAAVSALTITKEVIDWRTRTVSDSSTYAKIIGANAASALLFNDRTAATDTLSALSATPDVIYGGVYDDRGDVFAVYGPAAKGPKRLTPARPPLGHQFSGGYLVVSGPIAFKGDRVGTIYIRTDLSRLYRDVLVGGALTLLAGLAAFAIAALLITRLQRSIVGPILELSTAMEGISQSRDYAVRVTPRGDDEVGALAKWFNSMLETIQARDAALAAHGEELEKTVKQRTADLKDSNAQLEKELIERKVAQDELHAHDAMLKTVARSAQELLEAINLDDAINTVLELVGQTLVVNRVELCDIKTDTAGHLRMSVQNEWVAANGRRFFTDPAVRDVDLNVAFSAAVSPLLLGERVSFVRDQFIEPFKVIAEQSEIESLLLVPVMVESKLWGTLAFTDPSPEKRQWTWAETDTLATLASLMGVSITRAKFVKELADANRIVQNSPTVLYRLKGEPQLPLTYISHNIVKFGYEPDELVASGKFFQTLVHPEDQQKVLDAMAAVTERDAQGATIEFRLMQPSGAFRWVENRYTPVRDDVGRLIEIEGIIIDVTERKAAEDKIAQLARTDALTGLANRATFLERLHQAFIATKRGGAAFAVLYLDLDHFKDINDTRGHPVGDLLLREVGLRLQSLVRESDLIARLGGDEFAVLQMDLSDPADAGALASKVCAALAEVYPIDGARLHVSASVGISLSGPDISAPDVLLTQADLALYRAKEDGRNRYRFHSDDIDRLVNERVVMADELREAIERHEFQLHYQPQVELRTGRIVGMEALVRWNHPRRGLLQPADFLSIAERTGVIQALGHWVLEEACRQMMAWREQKVAPPSIAVNVSLYQLKTGSAFVQDVADTLAKTGLPPDVLELDVTESMLAQLTLARNDVLDRLAKTGVKIALDDFGTDYSSFDYLRTYRVNHLKVARDSVERATKDTKRATTIRAILGMAKELGIQVIAEGLETEEQRALLLSIGPSTKAQGFYFSEAVEAGKATELLEHKVIEKRAQRKSVA